MNVSSATAARRSHLADRIRRARRDAGLTQTELAARVGVTSSAVAQWEHPDGTCPEILKLESIAAALGVQVEWLAVGRGRQKKTSEAGGETPAVKLDFFAQDSAEEVLLERFRALPPRGRQLLSEFLEEIAAIRRVRIALRRNGAASRDQRRISSFTSWSNAKLPRTAARA
jgi:transcriptional regulator with XRE-family HTH domain